MIFVQRTGTTGDVAFTRAGARVLDRNGAVVADWTTGGVLRNIPQGDGYTLEVRTGSQVRSDALAIGAVVFTIGQSNIQRWYDVPTAVADAPSGTYMMGTDGGIDRLEGAASTHFAKEYAAAAGVPVLMVAAAKGGTALTPGADKGNGYWLDTSSGSLYSTALNLLQKVGGTAEVVLWAQGETDASQSVSQATYASALTTFMNRVLNDFGVAKVLIQELGPRGDNGSVYDAVRAAQHQVADAMADVDIGAIATDLNTIEDGIHLTGASRALAADRLLDDALARIGIDYSRALQSGSATVAVDDTLTSGSGRDELRGYAGNDTLSGGAGSDVLLGGPGNDTISGGSGIDLIRGDAGNDVIEAGDDDDIVSGGDGNDVIGGGGGRDEVWADAGDDTAAGGAGNDVMYGGAGYDTAVYSGNFGGYAVTVSGSRVTVRDIDLANGDEGTDVLDGFELLEFGDRTYDPRGAGLPPLFSTSTDFADFATIEAGTYSPTSLYNGLGGNDEVYLPKDAATAARAGYDTSAIFDGGEGDDIIIGGSLNETIRGGLGNDLINGAGGSDRMEGGKGDDTYFVDVTAVGSTGDLVVEKANEGMDAVISTVPHTLKSNVENLTLTGVDPINGTGNDLNNVIFGNGGRNTLVGNLGNDRLFGAGGDDTLRGDAGHDYLDGGEGRDIASFAGKMSDYSIHVVDGVATVVDLNTADGNDGTDETRNIETLRFSDGTYSLYIPGSLFTLGADALDFANVIAGTYVAGSQYAALDGDDVVWLPQDLQAAVAAGYDPAVFFDAGPGNDTIHGRGLDDLIKGGDGDDVLDGGAGQDRLEGGRGNDTYYVDVTAAGTTGDIVVEAQGEGIDTVVSVVTHTLKSHVENLTLTGSIDISGFGNDLDNVLYGNEGRNSIKGDAGNDSIFGQSGDDNLTGGLGNDAIDGGEGNDIASFSGSIADYHIVVSNSRAVITDLRAEDGDEGTDTLVSVETLKFLDGTLTVPHGAPPTDIHISNSNVVENSPGGTVVGNLSTVDPDVLDSFTYRLLDDAGGRFAISRAAIVVAPGANLDFETVSSWSVTIEATDASGYAVQKAFVISIGNADGIVVTGTASADTLLGTPEDDVVDGLGGADIMLGGDGSDRYIVDNARDRINELAGAGWDTIVSSVSFTLAANVEDLVLTGIAEKGTGNELANEITGNDLGNALNGMGGDDTLLGGLGNDTYIVDSLGDLVIESADGGTDVIKTGLDIYTLAANVENLIYTGVAAFRGKGNELANTLFGGTGNDHLDGGDDLVKDSLKGGLGDDVYILRANDSIGEAADAGHDTAMTALGTCKLSSNVEDLIFTGTGDFKGTGNTADNLVRGGAGNDTLDGGAGSDRLMGGAGNDIYVLDSSLDQAFEFIDPDDPTSGDAGGHDLILIKSGLTNFDLSGTPLVEDLTYSGISAFWALGSDLDNAIKTGGGQDTLLGGLGHDILTGGSGADVFMFADAGEGGDTITDFSRTQGDKIAVDAAAFGLAAGQPLPADWLTLGTSATSSSHGQFVYDASSRQLFWDIDGMGAMELQHIATFTKPITLQTNDFWVV